MGLIPTTKFPEWSEDIQIRDEDFAALKKRFSESWKYVMIRSPMRRRIRDGIVQR